MTVNICRDLRRRSERDVRLNQRTMRRMFRRTRRPRRPFRSSTGWFWRRSGD
jgi:hypothetical protein